MSQPGGFALFVSLFDAMDQTTSTTGKRAALESYFRHAAPGDVAWALFFLTGRRLRRLVSARELRDWAAAHSGLPPWLVEESYHAVGDLAETLALLCARGGDGEGSMSNGTLTEFVEQHLAPLASMSAAERRAEVLSWWRRLDERECFIAHKLVTGAFRVGVSASQTARAVAAVAGRDPAVIEHRLMGNWEPDPAFTARLLAPEDAADDPGRPYPFFLATPVDDDVAALGPIGAWMAEWKWDGVRAQLIKRAGTVFLWSRGEELISDRFPEITAAARALPEGTVLDGELVVWRDGNVLPFALLQSRLHRRTTPPRLLRDAPVVLLAFDCLEDSAVDCRAEPLRTRRTRLERLLRTSAGTLRLSPVLVTDDWAALGTLRDSARGRGVEGLMLKRWDSPYQAGRPRGDWWKWKVAPFTMDAVLVYAQPGHGRRAALHTDYTFAVRDGDALVPVAKAYSGLSDAELVRLDAWIRAHTVERFGPVRSVEPQHVFELGFEGIQRSTRHKAGVAVRFPRILRWRTDKQPHDATSLAELHAMIASPLPSAGAPTPHDLPTLFDVADDG